MAVFYPLRRTPKARQEEVAALDDAQLAALLAHLRGGPLYVPVLIAACTGLRRGELLALRTSPSVAFRRERCI